MEMFERLTTELPEGTGPDKMAQAAIKKVLTIFDEKEVEGIHDVSQPVYTEGKIKTEDVLGAQLPQAEYTSEWGEVIEDAVKEAYTASPVSFLAVNMLREQFTRMLLQGPDLYMDSFFVTDEAKNQEFTEKITAQAKAQAKIFHAMWGSEYAVEFKDV
jgi:hypothetical protein